MAIEFVTKWTCSSCCKSSETEYAQPARHPTGWASLYVRSKRSADRTVELCDDCIDRIEALLWPKEDSGLEKITAGPYR